MMISRANYNKAHVKQEDERVEGLPITVFVEISASVDDVKRVCV